MKKIFLFLLFLCSIPAVAQFGQISYGPLSGRCPGGSMLGFDQVNNQLYTCAQGQIWSLVTGSSAGTVFNTTPLNNGAFVIGTGGNSVAVDPNIVTDFNGNIVATSVTVSGNLTGSAGIFGSNGPGTCGTSCMSAAETGALGTPVSGQDMIQAYVNLTTGVHDFWCSRNLGAFGPCWFPYLTPSRAGDIPFSSSATNWTHISGNNGSTSCLQETGAGSPQWGLCTTTSATVVASTAACYKSVGPPAVLGYCSSALSGSPPTCTCN